MAILVRTREIPSHAVKRIYAQTAAQTAACVIPAGAVLYLRISPLLVGVMLYLPIFCFLCIHAFRRDPLRFTAISIAVLPFVITIRNQYLFSGLLVIYSGALILWAVFEPQKIYRLFSNFVRASLFIVCTAYWLISWARTGQYSVNSHAVELILAAFCIFLLGTERSWLTASLIGFAITTFVLAVAMSPSGERLGAEQVGALMFGNPILLGIASSITLLLALANQGAWLGLRTHNRIRLLVIGGAALCLVFTTSRGSWLVTSIGILLIALFSKGDRKTLALGIILGTPCIAFFLGHSDRAESVLEFFNRATAADRTLAQRTTGRATQWEALPQVLRTSPAFGFGPGSGATVDAKFTGRDKAWHSLYLQLIIETGCLGSLYFLLIAIILVRNGVRHWRMTGEIAPLLSIVAYLSIGFSVSAFDGLSGIFLGISLLGAELSSFRRLEVSREMRPEPAFA